MQNEIKFAVCQRIELTDDCSSFTSNQVHTEFYTVSKFEQVDYFYSHKLQQNNVHRNDEPMMYCQLRKQ